jgi:ATP-dependent 26S proteasome regulatory subunit
MSSHIWNDAEPQREVVTNASYRDSLEHLTDELRRLDLILEGSIAHFRSRRGGNPLDEFRGLYLSEEEIDNLFSPGADGDNQAGKADADIAAASNTIRERIIKSHEAGVYLRLPHLSSVFGLSDFETDILLLALAPELDQRYQKLYSYVQDDVTRKRPTVGLALQLFCSNLEERIIGRKAFNEDSQLFASSLIRLYDDSGEKPAPLISRFIKMEQRVVEFLLGDDRPDNSLAESGESLRRVMPRFDLDALVLPQNVKALAEKFPAMAADGGPWTCCLHGPRGVGKKTLAEAICKALNQSLLFIDFPGVVGIDIQLRNLVRAGLREARIFGSAVYFNRWHEITANESGRISALHIVEEEIKRFPGLIFIGSHASWQPSDLASHRFVALELQHPSEQQRQNLWELYLHTNGRRVDPEVSPAHLAASFRFTAGQIQQCISSAEHHAQLHQGPDFQLSMENLLARCREEATQHLVSFAKQVTPKRSWEDLVLPKDTFAHLREFCQQVRCRAKVYDDWGFGNKLSLGKGLLALFTGVSGTGKTLTAEIMANALGLGLYKVDLSCVVSKYIGETEKNLSRVFQDAQESNAILFFDEADALFGKRTEVKDAHDRYANIEINYLLQRVEEYEGVIIMSSNMSNNIDPAFLRRMQASIDFPFPDENNRLQIWRGIFPHQTPLADDVDLDFLARKFKITGGNIKNVALAAAFRAAEDGNAVRMEHLILAMKREYQKLDKVCEKSEFGNFYDLVR